jgi:hypothetical protein
MMSFHSLLFKKKKNKTKKQCHFDCTIHLLLPLNALKVGKKGFFPLLCSVSLSLSLSLSLTCPKTLTQPTPPMAYHQDEKQRRQALRATLEQLHSSRPTPYPFSVTG